MSLFETSVNTNIHNWHMDNKLNQIIAEKLLKIF